MMAIIMHEEVQPIRHVDFFFSSLLPRMWSTVEKGTLMHLCNLIKTSAQSNFLKAFDLWEWRDIWEGPFKNVEKSGRVGENAKGKVPEYFGLVLSAKMDVFGFSVIRESVSKPFLTWFIWVPRSWSSLERPAVPSRIKSPRPPATGIWCNWRTPIRTPCSPTRSSQTSTESYLAKTSSIHQGYPSSDISIGPESEHFTKIQPNTL